MSKKRYHIEFSGKIIPGWNIDEVKANLAKLLKANDEQLYRLFSGRRLIIKKNVDHLTAIKINNLFKDAGADCIITRVPGSDAAVPPPLPSQSGPGQTDQKPTVTAKPALGPTDIRPARFWYAVAILLFLILMIGGGKSIFTAFRSFFSEGTRLTVPGETTIQAATPGTYYIFYETSVFTESNVAQNLMNRNFNIMIMDLATGAELKLSPPEFDGTETYGAIVRRAIAEVEFNTSGNYLATVAGELSGRDGLLIRHIDFTGMIKDIISAVVLFLLAMIAGPVIALVVFIKRQDHKRKMRNAPMSEKEERQWAMFAHIGTFSSMFVPLGNIIAPIVIWQLNKNESPFVVEQAKESLNFQITLMIYALISVLLVFILIGFLLIFALVIFGLIIVIVAGVKANEGEHYRYPMTLRLIS